MSVTWADAKAFGKEIKSFSGVVTAASTLLPLTGLAWDVWTPPFPEDWYSWASAGGVLSILFVFLYNFRRTSAVECRAMSSRWLIVVLILLVLYIATMAAWTGRAGSGSQFRFIAGLGFTEEVQRRIEANELKERDLELMFQEYGYRDIDQNEIWLYRWLTKTVTLSLFIFIFIALSGGFALLVVANMTQKLASKPAPAAATPAGGSGPGEGRSTT
jgi:cell division protein FtsB